MKGMRLIALATAVTVICAGLAVGVTAQRGPAGPRGGDTGPGDNTPPPPPPTIKAGKTGVFVLLGGTINKLDPATLSEAGSLQLMQKPEQQSADGQQQPPPPGIMMLAPGSPGHPEMLVAIFGDKLFSVDAAQFAVVAEATLPKPEPPAEEGMAAMNRGSRERRGPGGPGGQGQQDQQRPAGPPRQVELQGSTVYVIDGPQITAVDIHSGTITGQTTLPKTEDRKARNDNPGPNKVNFDAL